MHSRITKAGAVIVLVASALAITVGTARAAGRAPAAQAVQLTGSQLAAALLPAGAFPPGYRYDKSTSHESGKRLGTGKAKYHLASISCTTLSNVYGQSGFGETAVATNSYSTLVDNSPPRAGLGSRRRFTSSPTRARRGRSGRGSVPSRSGARDLD